MKKKRLLLFILICAVCSGMYATGNNAQVTVTTQGVKAVQNGIVTDISFYSPSIVRVQKYNENENVTKHNLVVTLSPETVSIAPEETESLVTLRSDEITVTFNKSNGQVIFYDKNGNQTLYEKAGACEINDTKDGTFDSFNVKQTFTLENNEQIYGLGQLLNGDLSQRGKSYWSMVQGNTSVWIPYIHSVKGYALYWDNYAPTTFLDNESGMSFESAAGYGVNYYYLGGSNESGDKAVAQMRKLSGKAPMIPLWSYGYFQSKERYQSADETMSVVKKYRDLGVPLDCIVQDWQYWGGNNQWNAMEFLNPSFSNYQQMIDSVHNMNAKIIISFWANFGPDTKQFSHLMNMNALIKSGNDIMTDTYPSNEGVAIYDTYNKNARDYIWDCVYGGLTSKGIDAYWMDSSEPDHYQGGDDREKTFDFVTGLGTTWRSVRNAYPLVHVGGIHDSHRAEAACNQKRVTILTRSAFAGQQRYGANTWSGDIVANWETLANQIPAALNFTMCGIPNWNSDIGGFFNGDYSGAGEEAYNELYARWIQFGTFCTMMRSHGAGADRAIYRFGERGTMYFDVIEKYINLRYALLPYIYSTGWDVHNNDGSFMRALPLAYPKDANTHLIKHDFMFGQSILVSPIIESGASERSVYLPEGNDWIDIWTGKKQNGGSTINKKVDLQTLPLYAKAGSIIPWGPKVEYSTQERWDSLEVRIYAGANGSFILYEDEFDNYNYEQSKYTQIPFSWNESTQQLTIGARERNYDGMIQSRKFAIVLVDEETGIGVEQSNRISKIVEYNGSAITIKIDNENVIINNSNNNEQEENFSATKEYFPLNDVSKTTFWYGIGNGNFDVATKTISYNGEYQSWGWGYGNMALSPSGQIVTRDEVVDVSDYKYLVAKFNHVENLVIFRVEYYDADGVLHANEAENNGIANPDARLEFAPGTNEDNYSFMKNADGSYIVKVNLQALGIKKLSKVYIWNAWENANNYMILDEAYLANSTTYSRGVVSEEYQSICIPRNMTCTTQGASFYKVIGVNSKSQPSKLYMEAYNGELEAGVPYIFMSPSSKIYFDLGSDFVTSESSQSGLIGNFDNILVPANASNYIMDKGKLLLVGSEYNNSAYSAYINLELVPLYNGSGEDPYITINGNITSINTEKYTENPIVDVYSIMGIKIRSKVERSQATMGLASGIYIIDRQKVIIR